MYAVVSTSTQDWLYTRLSAIGLALILIANTVSYASSRPLLGDVSSDVIPLPEHATVRELLQGSAPATGSAPSCYATSSGGYQEGDNIMCGTWQNLAAAKAACDARASCVSFSFSSVVSAAGGSGCLKSSMYGVFVASSGYNGYIKIACPVQDQCFSALSGGYPEADGGAAGNIACKTWPSLDAAKGECDASSACQGFSWSQASLSGCLKSNLDGGWVASNTFNGYIQSSCPATAQCYNTHKGGYPEASGGAAGNIVCKTWASLDAAKAECTASSACVGFSFSFATMSGCLKNNDQGGFVFSNEYTGHMKATQCQASVATSIGFAVAVNPGSPVIDRFSCDYDTGTLYQGLIGLDVLGAAVATGCTSDPSALWEGGRLHVVFRNRQGSVTHAVFGTPAGSTIAAWTVEDLGGQILQSPTIASQAAGRLDVLVWGTDHRLWAKSYAAGAWGPFRQAASNLPIMSSPPAATWPILASQAVPSDNTTNALHVFYLDASTNIIHVLWTDVDWNDQAAHGTPYLPSTPFGIQAGPFPVPPTAVSIPDAVMVIAPSLSIDYYLTYNKVSLVPRGYSYFVNSGLTFPSKLSMAYQGGGQGVSPLNLMLYQRTSSLQVYQGYFDGTGLLVAWYPLTEPSWTQKAVPPPLNL